MYLGVLLGLVYGQNLLFSRSSVMSRKFVVAVLVSTVIFRPSDLKSSVMSLRILSAFGPVALFTTISPSSRYSPPLQLVTIGLMRWSRYMPTSSHVSAPSHDPMVTSNPSLLAIFVQGVPSLNRRDFLMLDGAYRCFVDVGHVSSMLQSSVRQVFGYGGVEINDVKCYEFNFLFVVDLSEP